MAIELIGMTGGHPEQLNPTFVNPAVMAVVNNANLERIIAKGLNVSDSGQIPITDVRDLIQMSQEIRTASRKEVGGFKEIVVYLGKKSHDISRGVGAVSFVGVERSVPIPFAGQTSAILDDLSPESDILIVHLHPESPEASNEDLSALQTIARALSVKSDRNIRASLLIIGDKDNEEILYTFDSRGKYMTVILENLLARERLSPPLLDKLFLLIYRGDRFDKAADAYQSTWYRDNKLYPPEIPGIGLLLPGYLNSTPQTASIPDQAIIAEPKSNLLVLRNTGDTGKWPVIYIEKDGIVQPLERQYNGKQYCYLLNGIPYFAAPNSFILTSGVKIGIPQGGIKVADYKINLTGGRNIHEIDILAVPKDSLPREAK